jgi:RHS repeat-associated protein
MFSKGYERNATTGWDETYFRMYDPAIGRFHGVDPLAVKYAGMTPYNYVGGNPIMNNDPLGDKPLRMGQNELTGMHDWWMPAQNSITGQGYMFETHNGLSTYLGFHGPGGQFMGIDQLTNSYTMADIMSNELAFFKTQLKNGHYGTRTNSGSSKMSAVQIAGTINYLYNSTPLGGFIFPSSGFVHQFSSEMEQIGFLLAGMNVGANWGIQQDGIDYLRYRQFEKSAISCNCDEKKGNDGFNIVDGAKSVLGFIELAFASAAETAPSELSRKLATKTSKRLGIAGIVLTPVDAFLVGEWKNSHSADIGLGVVFIVAGTVAAGTLAAVPVAFGTASFFVGDFFVTAITGDSITEHIFD